jgi:hypothetical protein
MSLSAAATPRSPLEPDSVVPAPIVMPRPQIDFDIPGATQASAFIPSVNTLPVSWTPATQPTPPMAFQLAEDPYFLPIPATPPNPDSPVGVRPCRNCSLAVSAKARFCRRCGAAQFDN